MQRKRWSSSSLAYRSKNILRMCNCVCHYTVCYVCSCQATTFACFVSSVRARESEGDHTFHSFSRLAHKQQIPTQQTSARTQTVYDNSAHTDNRQAPAFRAGATKFTAVVCYAVYAHAKLTNIFYMGTGDLSILLRLTNCANVYFRHIPQKVTHM